MPFPEWSTVGRSARANLPSAVAPHQPSTGYDNDVEQHSIESFIIHIDTSGCFFFPGRKEV